MFPPLIEFCHHRVRFRFRHIVAPFVTHSLFPPVITLIPYSTAISPSLFPFIPGASSRSVGDQGSGDCTFLANIRVHRISPVEHADGRELLTNENKTVHGHVPSALVSGASLVSFPSIQSGCCASFPCAYRLGICPIIAEYIYIAPLRSCLFAAPHSIAFFFSLSLSADHHRAQSCSHSSCVLQSPTADPAVFDCVGHVFRLNIGRYVLPPRLPIGYPCCSRVCQPFFQKRLRTDCGHETRLSHRSLHKLLFLRTFISTIFFLSRLHLHPLKVHTSRPLDFVLASSIYLPPFDPIPLSSVPVYFYRLSMSIIPSVGNNVGRHLQSRLLFFTQPVCDSVSTLKFTPPPASIFC